MNKTQSFAILLMILGSLISCTPKEDPVPDEPQISVVSISPLQSVEFAKEVVLELGYEDFQGDLGDADPDERSLWVLDSRLKIADTYHIQPISPDGADPHVKGTLVVPLRRIFLLGTGNSESFFYSIKLKDRAGNWSSVVQTPEITVSR